MRHEAGPFIRWEAQRRAAAGDLEGALALADLAAPEDAGGWVLFGKIRAQRGEFKEAAAAFREALALEPNHAEAKRGLELAERLASSPLGRLRLHSRRWVVGALCAAAVAAGVWMGMKDRVSNRDLAASLAELDRNVAASHTSMRDNGQSLAGRLSRLEQALQTQADSNGRASAELRGELQRMQAKLAGTVTAEQLQATRAEMLESLKRMEAAMAEARKK